MRGLILGLVAAFGLMTAIPSTPVLAQGTTPTTPAPTANPAPRRKRTARTTKPAREPSVKQLAARQRMKTCGAEWREAKKAKTTNGQTWRQYFKTCNARLQGRQV